MRKSNMDYAMARRCLSTIHPKVEGSTRREFGVRLLSIHDVTAICPQTCITQAMLILATAHVIV